MCFNDPQEVCRERGLMNLRIRFALASVAVVVIVAAAHSQHVGISPAIAAQESISRAMALTFDDLPYAHVSLDDPGALSRAQVVTSALLRSLAAHSAPVVAFVNEAQLGSGVNRDSRVSLLQQWIDAGAVLGNHTFSHADFNMLTVEEFQNEIVKGEMVTRQLMQSREPYQLYFRHPQTHTGDTGEKKASIEQFLGSRGYQIAPHTIDSADYIFNVWYVQALNSNDQAMATRIQTEYLEFVIRATEFAEYIAPRIFGRDIPQTLIVHANDINADTLDALLKRLEERGYRFVTLDSAMSDTAYQTRDTLVTSFGPTWLWRWRQSLGLAVSFRDDPEPPDWILELYNAIS